MYFMEVGLVKINGICLVTIGLIVFALATAGHSAPELGAAPVVVKDKNGKQVGIYKESHALVIGAGDYANRPRLQGVMDDLRDNGGGFRCAR